MRPDIKRLALAVLLAVPWLTPFASGPSPAVTPWLTCLICLGLMLALIPLRRPALPVLILYAGLGLFALLRGPGLHLSGTITLILLGTGLACAAIGAAAARDAQLALVIAGAWLAAALLSCLIALCQYAGVEHFFAPWMNQSGLGQVFANLRQRNQFATLTTIGLAALCWFAAQGRLPRLLPWMLLLLAVGNAASASRAGMTQWVALALMAWIWRGGMALPVRRLIWAGLGVYLLAVGLMTVLEASPFTAFSRLDMRNEGCRGRGYLWANVADLITQKPWLGWGWRDLAWAHHMGEFTQRFCDIPDNAHSLPLHLAVELGLPAALLFMGLLSWMLLRARPWLERDPLRQLGWSVVAAILIHSLLEYPLWYGPFQMAFGLALGILFPSAMPAGAGAASAQRQPAMLLQALLAASVLAGSVYAARDYHRVSQLYLAPELRDAGLREDTLAKVRGSWLFAPQVRFAELFMTPLTPDNARTQHEMAQDLLHYSPEPRVIEKLIASAKLLGLNEEVELQAARYRAAFPADYQHWVQEPADSAK